MKINRLKKSLQDGNIAIGASVASSSALIAEHLGIGGFDFVTIDLQHGEANIDDLQRLLYAIDSTEAASSVRVPVNEPGMIQRCLDLGAQCVVVPNVDTVDQAKAVVDATRYPPLGRRSWGPIRSAIFTDADYFHQANQQALVLVMLESGEAVENAEEILALEGIDGCVIGPNDLNLSCGNVAQFPKMTDAVERCIDQILSAAKKCGKVAGIAGAAGQANQRIEQGFQFLFCGLDVRMVADSTKLLLSGIRR